ncbi:heparinase II/III family protein [Kordiimonas pumila]|uniref:Heparinase II/III family protein n=1 Tax=Kordiimonas pumila TaxID=2161677 RepID=A0ABV7D4P7_9PROT|nr:heparinase II/III family protein [Kordiimonas pumila]
MNAAFDKIAGYASNAPLTRSTLRRDTGFYLPQEVWQKISRAVKEWGYGSSLYEYRLKGRHPVQLLGSPDDPAPGNATLGSAIFGGDMLHAGEQHKLEPAFWQKLDKASPSFRRYAHSFHWLQDLAQTHDQKKARDAAETIIGWWLPVGEKWDREIWQAETLARRLINWFVHAPLILSSLDLVYRSKVLHTMARQARHLARVHSDVPAGLSEIYTGTALTLAGLLLPGGSALHARGTRFLERTCKTFILPDGGPASRNAADVIRTMQLLILVRSAYVETDSDLPSWVQITLDRIAPYIRAMRHGDGSFAQIGGVSAEGGHGTNAVLAASEAKGKATENSAYSGIQRVTAAATCLIMDTGTPPAWPLMKKAHAGTGSFELSVAQERLIVNVGPASDRGPFPELAVMTRSTAAHSALIVADRNSSRLMDNGKLGAGVTETLTLRETLENGTRIRLIHDGYLKRFGVKHERALTLTANGKKLLGEDKLFGPKSQKLQGHTVVLRFHLHPSVEATKAPDGRITLALKSGRVWIFDVDKGSGAKANIEDSLYVSRPDKPVAARQIVVTIPNRENETPICTWQLSEMDI